MPKNLNIQCALTLKRATFSLFGIFESGLTCLTYLYSPWKEPISYAVAFSECVNVYLLLHDNFDSSFQLFSVYFCVLARLLVICHGTRIIYISFCVFYRF
jgi:hypothetical protein